MKYPVTPNGIKRGAWNYKKRDRPSFSALFKSPLDRRRFIRAWIIEPIGYAADFIGHFALKLLPVDACSDIGAVLGRVVMKYKNKESVANIRRNLEVLLPQVPSHEREIILTRNCESLGRLMTEYSVLTRICNSKSRINIVGLGGSIDVARGGSPVILIGLHLGNWEILSSVSKTLGIPFYAFVLPMDNPVEAWVTNRVRTKLGANILPIGMSGVGPAMRVLRQGGVISLFCDEGFSGLIRGPLFGRDAHLKGNLAVAARLARRTGAKLCIVNTLRLRSANFECHFSPPFELPGENEGRDIEDLLKDVSFINDLIEPIIMKNLDQWYYLHYRL